MRILRYDVKRSFFVLYGSTSSHHRPVLGEPSRETHMQFVPYVTLDVCRMPVFVRYFRHCFPASCIPTPSLCVFCGQIHHICDMDKPSCKAAMRAAHDRLNAQHGWLMGPHAPHMDKPPGEIYPLGASCATCKTDESSRGDMKRCSACKMTR